MLPPDALPYRRTAVFTESDIPAALRRSHATRPGAWGAIHVLEGRLAYRITDPRCAAIQTILTPDTGFGVIEPTILHEVNPLGPVRFFVEFHRLPDSDPAPVSNPPARKKDPACSV
ncbi:MAG TPA: DUF1971 domain-containing protein [Caulobacteraceae bacterium]|jgi:tellurite resistance-related uncharacterized protein|nr:DUF1971 domain-containing protein [Caulobacteraceae bacterium]